VNTSFDHTMSYTYDNVNRLTEAMATGNSSFTQTYGYTGDGSTGQYGNMTCKTGCANMPANVTFSASTNQITSPNYTYDAAGDLTKDSSNSTAHTYQWDAEGRVSKVDSGTTWTFTYNAMGDRVAWVSGGVTSDHLFDPSGTWLGVAGSYSFVMLGIRPLAVYNTSDTWFHHVNNIGSRTMMTAHYGNATQDMVFYPFGGLWLNWGGGGLEFADLTYDDPNSNSQLTTYRLFSGNLGRWHSPDPLGGDVTNPQSLNRYGYVLNNPTGLIDPLGLDPGQGSDPGECDCNDPNCVNAACWGPGWPPGFWPPNGGEGSGGSGGGGPAIHLPTGNTGGPGMPNGFLEPGTGVIDLDVTFGITTWGWPLVVACATDPVCAVPAATVAVAGAGYLVYKGIQAGVQVYQSSAKARDIRQIARAYCIDPNVLGAAVHADKKGGPSEPGYDLSKQGIIDIAKRLSEDPRNRIPGCVPHPF
jgi:RHS repeat-associated protein